MAAAPIATSRNRHLSGLSASALSRALWNAEVPEEFVKSVPAQSLYLALKVRGVASSADIVSIATIEQCRLMLDFDCWSGDRFSEDSFFEWLALGDSTDNDQDEGLKIIQKLLKSIDLRLIALIVARHVEIATFDEPTDEPPAPGYYTPDKGRTWILIKAPNADRHFYLGRLLALLFETSAEIFYQILAAPQVATTSMLEEEAFADRQKRLVSLGIPEPEVVAEVNTPLPLNKALSQISHSQNVVAAQDIDAVTPLIYHSDLPSPLNSLVSQISDREAFERELSFILNAAMVRWSVPFHSFEAVMLLASKVRGALNIGMEAVHQSGRSDLLEIYNSIGLRSLYQVGLSYLMDLRRQALKIDSKQIGPLSQLSPEKALIIQGCREPFPHIPLQIIESIEHPETSSDCADEAKIHNLSQRMGALFNLRQINAAREVLESANIERGIRSGG